MVDINLIGEEKSREQEYRDENIAQSLNYESTSQSTEGGGYSSDLSEFSNNSGNARLYIILGALVILIVAVIYLLIPDDEQETQTLSTPSREEVADLPAQGMEGTAESAPEQGLAEDVQGQEQLGEPERVESSINNLSSMSPLEQKMLLSNRLGRYTISSLANVLSEQGIFTLIRFAENNFLAQFVTSSSSSTANTISRVRAEISTVNLEKITEEAFSTRGDGRMQSIIAGEVSAETAPISYAGRIQDITPGALKTWIDETANENGLHSKNIKQSSAYAESGYTVTPIQVNLQGNLSAAIGFLDDLDGLSPSVVINKLSLINKDPSARTQDSVSLVFVLKVYSY